MLKVLNAVATDNSDNMWQIRTRKLLGAVYTQSLIRALM